MKNTANSYREWAEQAQLLDQQSGADDWKETEKTDHYDHAVIRRRYDELKAIVDNEDIEGLLYYLNEGLHGNMGGMGSPKLHDRAQFGTKTLIQDYIDLLVAALRILMDTSAVSEREKLTYFQRASRCFGRTALMLTGASSLGAFHLGVIKALDAEGLLPSVISGSGAGSFVAAGLHGNVISRFLHVFEESGKLPGGTEYVFHFRIEPLF